MTYTFHTCPVTLTQIKKKGMYNIYRDTVVICICVLVGWNKNNKRWKAHALK